MWQRQWRNVQIPDDKRTVDHSRIRNKITFRPGAAMKCISKYPCEILHRGFIRIHWQARAAAQVAKSPAIIQAHNVVRMGVGKKDSIQPADIFTQYLDPEFRRRIYYQLDLFGSHIDGGAGAMIFQISEELRRVLFSDDGNALRCAGAKENEGKRHVAN